MLCNNQVGVYFTMVHVSTLLLANVLLRDGRKDIAESAVQYISATNVFRFRCSRVAHSHCRQVFDQSTTSNKLIS